MPRQNRVNPFGDLITTDARGALMGNRGILHDGNGNLTTRRWAHPNWVACETEFKGIKRPLMHPGSYTELFFLDEATALAAGHRPCWECRREDFTRFRDAWLRGNPDEECDETTSMSAIDRIIHRDRVTRAREKITYRSELASLPDGVFVALPERPADAMLLWKGKLYPWQSSGYGSAQAMPAHLAVIVLTPHCIVRAIAAGYRPTTALTQDF
ncbi:hypothetical protein OR1_04078 [Geobacter sp. OR-1]|uniref:hypothetical protein n=1 Tax=Geobacter sp. OR-1 TaxID=1266765 RepID=UPI000541D756|nr:hypothetical protein [Geobacter sp. OR-1]GAM11760.1 hypothetical protein OR1_04078 [Geobacter sp. OR-1]